MKPDSQSKTPLHLRLTTNDWVECFTQLTRAELGVFYYIRTRDPYGDRFLEIDCAQVGELLGLHRTSVSRALEQLKQKQLISLEIQKARVSSRIHNRRLTLLTQPENDEDTTTISNSAQQSDLCVHAQMSAPTHKEVQPRTDTYLPQFNECVHAQLCSPMHNHVQLCADECADAPICAPMHSDIYKDRACVQTLQTSTNIFQTETDNAPATCQTQSVSVELEEEETNRTTSTEVASSDRTQTCQLHDLHKDKISAAAEPEILRAIEAAIYNWRLRPWMETATTFKSEMVQAVWRCNPKWYSLEGSSTPNLKKICDRLRQLERQLKLLNADAIAAWEELQNYWRVATAMNNPDMQKQFHQVELVAKQQSLQSQLELRKQQTLAAIQGLL